MATRIATYCRHWLVNGDRYYVIKTTRIAKIIVACLDSQAARDAFAISKFCRDIRDIVRQKPKRLGCAVHRKKTRFVSSSLNGKPNQLMARNVRQDVLQSYILGSPRKKNNPYRIGCDFPFTTFLDWQRRFFHVPTLLIFRSFDRSTESLIFQSRIFRITPKTQKMRENRIDTSPLAQRMHYTRGDVTVAGRPVRALSCHVGPANDRQLRRANTATLIDKHDSGRITAATGLLPLLARRLSL